MNRQIPQRSTSATPPLPRPGVGRTKEPAHLPLHRRLLFPTIPLEQPLPSIIIASSNVKRSELEHLNNRLYNLIALILRAYVLSWYPRFSKDRTLLPTLSNRIIVPILSPILTGSYNDPDRIIQLILLDLPGILSLHWSTYWTAREALVSAPHLYISRTDDYLSAGLPTPFNADEYGRVGNIYHAQLPLLSVSPSPGFTPPPSDENTPYRLSIPSGQYVLSPLYLTSMTDALLRLHLPSSEYGCVVERVMAREIVGRCVIGAVGSKLGQGWFWWNLGLRFLGSPIIQTTPLEKKESKEAEEEEEVGIVQKLIGSLVRIFIKIYTGIIVFWTIGVSLFARYTAAPRTEERYINCAQPWMILAREILGVNGRMGISPRRWGLRISWGMIEGLITLLGPIIDRLIPHLIRSNLTISLSLRIIDILEKMLFPLDGYPAPSPADLTPEEAIITRNQFQARLTQIIPPYIQNIFFPTREDLGLMLDPLDNPGCNAHLTAMVLDSIVATLEPNLVVQH